MSVAKTRRKQMDTMAVLDLGPLLGGVETLFARPPTADNVTVSTWNSHC